jgi:phosphopantothenoylcysteine decarboxylase/phosphopantothenate--cysteine ligase
MLAVCLQQAPTADIVIAAAAVADYAPETVAASKIKKTGDDVLTLRLRPTTDIAATLGRQKPPGQTLVGFAAETERLDEHARAKLERKNLDLIVANDVTRPGAGFETDTNIVTLIARDGAATPVAADDQRQVADAILDRVVQLRSAAVNRQNVPVG